MNKKELVNEIAASAKITKADAEKMLQSVIEIICDSLSHGENVVLPGFGSFSIVKRQERTAINPGTGAKITVPAKKIVKFKAGKNLATEID